MNKWTIGDVTISRIVEVELPGLKFVLPDAIPDNLRQIPWLAPHFVNDEWQPLASIHALVVESQGRRIVVDTCLGNDKDLPRKGWGHRQGPFLADLAAAGFERESIDTVLCTHLHVDHVGWNTMLVNGRWAPTFPQARYLFGRIEWEHWNHHRGGWMPQVIDESIQPILDANLHTLVETDYCVTDEVWLEPSFGHTPGHVSVRIASRGSEAVITGDLMHHPCQIARDSWHCTADSDSAQAQATRRSFIERSAATGMLVIGTHFATPTAGHIVRDGESYRFQVLEGSS
jgi:glyoxylase-like metal-dependent hydrolase (beta-lactamase superfamily II)